MTRRSLIQSITAAVTVAGVGKKALAGEPAAGKPLKALYVNHISYQAKDYRATRDFYSKVLGMKVPHDDGNQCYLSFGDSLLIARNAEKGGRTPNVDHIAYTLQDYGTPGGNFKAESTAVYDKLKSFGLSPEPDTELSWFVNDPDGYKLQLTSSTMKVGNPTFERVIKEASQKK